MSWAHSLVEPASEGAAEREQRSYSIEGLSAREGLVLKSMIRLLSHRTECVWTYRADSSELKVVSNQPGVASAAASWAQQVLTLGAIDLKQSAYLRLPLHANELEAELNRMARLIKPATISLAAATGEAPDLLAPTAELHTQVMRLLRWPPATLLSKPGHIRMATLMLGSHMTVLTLQRHSGARLEDCVSFFADLNKAGLLESSAKLAASTAPSAALLAQPRDSKPQPKIVQPGLLARIRLRLAGVQKSGLPFSTK